MGNGDGSRVLPLRAADPATIGAYRLVGRLGEGGMGTVYLALHPEGHTVAVKVIRLDRLDNEEFRRRFQSEVKRARQVPPFCTAEVLDAGPDHDPPYLVVEYVDGPSLSAVVADRGPLTPSNLHGLAIGVATALTAIHGAGVIHRDLKPSNVLLPPGSPKVIDFGIAQAVQITEDAASTGAVVIGTVEYMAPERFEAEPGAALTPAADIFAWGAVVAFAGTGRTPFGGDSPEVTAVRIMTQPPTLDGLRGPLRDLVAWALDKDPTKRPTARQLLDALLGATSTRPREAAAAFARQPALLEAAEQAKAATDQHQLEDETTGEGTDAAPTKPASGKVGAGAVAGGAAGAVAAAGGAGAEVPAEPGTGGEPATVPADGPAGTVATDGDAVTVSADGDDVTVGSPADAGETAAAKTAVLGSEAKAGAEAAGVKGGGTAGRGGGASAAAGAGAMDTSSAETVVVSGAEGEARAAGETRAADTVAGPTAGAATAVTSPGKAATIVDRAAGTPASSVPPTAGTRPPVPSQPLTGPDGPRAAFAAPAPGGAAPTVPVVAPVDRWSRVTMAILAVIVLVGALTGAGFLSGLLPVERSSGSGGGGAASPLPSVVTATEVAPTTTAPATATVPPTPTPTATPPPTPTASATALSYVEDLRDPLTRAGWWQARDESAEGRGRCGFDEALVVRSGQNFNPFRCRGPQIPYGDVRVDVDVRLGDLAACAAIWFRFTDADGGWAARICADKIYVVPHGVDGVPARPVKEFELGERAFEVDEWVRLRLEAVGRDLVLSVDGTELGNTRLTLDGGIEAPASGRVTVGIFPTSGQGTPPFEVGFRDIVVYVVE